MKFFIFIQRNMRYQMFSIQVIYNDLKSYYLKVVKGEAEWLSTDKFKLIFGMMVLYWSLHQKKSINAVKCINKELKNLKNKKFLSYLYIEFKKLNSDINDLFLGVEGINLDEKIDFTSKCDGEINKEEKGLDCGVDDVIETFKNNIHYPNQVEYEKIQNWCKSYRCDVIILAIKQSINYNVRNIKYIDKILLNWAGKGITTAEAIYEYQKKWEERNKVEDNSSTSERKYDANELEKNLLG